MDQLLPRLADLLVGFGANVQAGQMVAIGSDVGKEQLTREIARCCYQRGAVFVDVMYADPYVKRARILHGVEAALGHEPAWTVARPLELAENGGASIGLTGLVEPGLLDGLDADRLRRDRFPGGKQWMALSSESKVNWTVGACPTPAWAAAVHPELPPVEALDRLWEHVAYACRLDADDPVGTWALRIGELQAARAWLSEARFEALHFLGPGTDLTIGLLPSSTWLGAEEETDGGIVFHPNVPSEEVFTTPDMLRAEGIVTATKPLEIDGTIVEGLVVRFEAGRVVSIEADSGADALRSRAARDEGASRLGEVALVDGRGRIGAMDTIFFDTLFDENAASHIALGNAYTASVADADDRPRANTSEIHVDFMIGSPEVVVTGVRPDGVRVPVLVGGDWAR